MQAIGLVKGSLVSGGLVTGPGAKSVYAEYKKVSVENDKISSHGEPPHASPIINKASCSTTVFANRKQVVIATATTASCGHRVDTGAGTVFVGP